MIVSHGHRLIFVKTKKTAGTSVEIALSVNVGPRDIVTRLTPADEETRAECGGVGPQNDRIPATRWRGSEFRRLRPGRWPVFRNHMPARDIRRILPRWWDEYLTFSIVRNPWDAVVSAYSWHCGRTRETVTLSEFISSGRAARVASWPILSDGGVVLLDEVVRYERLHEDMERLSERTGLDPAQLPHAKAQFRGERRHYRELMSRSDRDRVASMFRNEITYFGYEY
jgi:hypothetical protein